jgi:methionyl-tRNA formyltransferase
MDARVIFMGSPEFALPVLEALSHEYKVSGVVTQPDRPAGRGKTLTPPPVKELAVSLGLPVIQPNRLREPAATEQLRSWRPDLIVVAAFGQILRQEVLDLPPYGCINVHASLLPRWRGAAPIQAAILHGDVQTGVTIMRMDAGVDTGPTLAQKAIPIQSGDTAASLGARLAELGAKLLLETLPAYLAGELKPQPQDNSAATYASMLKKEDGLLDFNNPAQGLERKVRAFYPWPGAFFFWKEQMIKVLHAHTVYEPQSFRAGERTIYAGLPAVTTTAGILVMDEVQPAGKKPMPGIVFLNGAKGWKD